MFCLLLAKTHYPIDAPVVAFEHTDDASYYEARKQYTASKKTEIADFLAKIPFTDFTIPVKCGQSCKDFMDATAMTQKDYYLYNAYIQVIMDPMTAFYRLNTNYFSFGFRINEKTKNAKKYADLIQPLIYNLQSTSDNKFVSVAVAGYDGVLALESENALEFGTYVHQYDCDLGKNEGIPEYDEATFKAEIQAFLDMDEALTAGNLVLEQYILSVEKGVIIGDLRDYLENQMYYQNTIVSIADFAGKVGSYSKLDDYKRETDKIGDFITQSSCAALLNNFVASDFRMVTVEQSVHLNKKMTVSDFEQQMRVFPFRTSETPAMYTGQQGKDISTLEKCTDVFEGKDVVACADLPPAASWWSITLSIIIIAGTITVWVLGCKFSKKMDEQEIVNAE